MLAVRAWAVKSDRAVHSRCICDTDGTCYRSPVLPLYDRVLAFIADAGAERFDTLALDVFAHQFAHCAPYRQFCLRRGRTPDSVAEWTAIPAVPIVAFKRTELCCGQPVRSFFSSGTTAGRAMRSRHQVPDLRLYEHSATASLRRFLLWWPLRESVAEQE